VVICTTSTKLSELSLPKNVAARTFIFGPCAAHSVRLSYRPAITPTGSLPKAIDTDNP
jgi:hypothetical protein